MPLYHDITGRDGTRKTEGGKETSVMEEKKCYRMRVTDEVKGKIRGTSHTEVIGRMS